MKSKNCVIPVLLTVLMLVGCASGPTYNEVAGTIEPTPQGEGRIYIYRTTAFGAAIRPAIRLDGEIVGKAIPKGFFYIDRPAGTYQISASTEAKRSLSLNLEAGDQKYVRLEIKMGVFAGHVKPVLVDSAIGQEELKKTKYIGE